MNFKALPFTFALVSICPLFGCATSDDSTDSRMMDATLTYAEMVSANYSDSYAAAKQLQDAVSEFLEEPSASRLTDAQKAWISAREPYLQTEVYRFYGGPIDDEDAGPEGMLNAWPLDESYIDYVAGPGDEISHRGIINDEEIEISAAELMKLNEKGGDANIATGFHAIEFLLWGQDNNEDHPGDRPYTDYLLGDEGSAQNQDRRAKYLSVVAELLTEQLKDLKEQWRADEDNYRKEFESDDTKTSFAKILTGMLVLSGFETGGERLQAALDSGDQEDEHSCFSDNTHRDMIQDVQGVLNVYIGSYTDLNDKRVSGPSVRDVVEGFDSVLAEELEDKIRESLALANALEVPFDRAIANDNDEGRAGVEALITSLFEQKKLLEEVFRGLDLNIPEDE